eukprot:g21587.t1
MVRDGAHGRQPQRRRLRPLADVLASEDPTSSPRSSFYTCELPDNLPEKEAAPPNRVMHDIAVQRLHDYLQGVQRHPRKLVKAVADHRGEASMKGRKLTLKQIGFGRLRRRPCALETCLTSGCSLAATSRNPSMRMLLPTRRHPSWSSECCRQLGASQKVCSDFASLQN